LFFYSEFYDQTNDLHESTNLVDDAAYGGRDAAG
jgi:hypothetical protein